MCDKKRLERLLVAIFPLRFHGILGLLYGLLSSAKQSYSQHGEDLIVIAFFERIGIRRGVYLDVGAYHPKLMSNTYLLHKRGWSGFCVDIDEAKLKWFRLLRGKRCKTICAALVEKTRETIGFVKVYKHKRLLSEIDTLSKEVAERNKKNLGWDYVEDMVPVIGPEYLRECGPVDLLNIDIEGLDTLVLLSMDLTKFNPKLILFEDNENFGGCEKLKRYLNNHNYQLLFKSGGTVGYYFEKSSTDVVAR